VSIGISPTGTFTLSIPMSSSHSITLNSVTQYLVTIVGPPNVNATPRSPTGDGYFDSGSKVTFTVPSIWNGSKPGVRAVLSSYVLDNGPLVATNSSDSASYTTPIVVFTKAHSLGFAADTQYQVSFKFFDINGRNPVSPSDVQLIAGNATMDLQGEPAWLKDGASFQVVGVFWEGSSVGPLPAPSFTVQAAPLNVTLNTKVYPASLKVVDLFGFPVSGAQVSMMLANGTVVTGTTKGDGTFAVAMVPLGTFTATVSSFGSNAQIIGNSASTQPVAQGKVALSVISLGAVGALFVGGGVTALLLFRRRRGGVGGIQV